VSLIGTLEQLSLANILQRIEMYEKNGMLVLQQGETWAELYIRGGRLICIGPVRTAMTLGEQLLQDGIISPQALQDTYQTLRETQPGETRVALALMDRGQLGHEDLRGWATKKALAALKILLTWTSGEIYFEEDVAPTSDRLLVALSISTLLSSLSASSPPSQQPALDKFYPSNRQAIPATPVPTAKFPPSQDTPEVSTLTSTGQFLLDAIPDEMSFPSTGALAPTFTTPENPLSASLAGSQAPFAPAITTSLGNPLSASLPGIQMPSTPAASFTPPQPVTMPVTPKYVDTSFMRPEMVLVPVDLSALREQNPSVQLTPEQWRLLTHVDGRTSLQVACQDLGLLPEQICSIAGSLLAEGLIQLSMPTGALPMNELSPVSQGLVTAGLSNGYVAPGPAAAPVQPWSSGFSPSESKPYFASSLPFETQSQWGNGANGAIFVPGQGWVASPQSLQPENSSGMFNGSSVYTPAGSQRNQLY
jgi:hypothetical protein